VRQSAIGWLGTGLIVVRSAFQLASLLVEAAIELAAKARTD
jgi:hypothetical protein